jgi:hypothetical protein
MDLTDYLFIAAIAAVVGLAILRTLRELRRDLRFTRQTREDSARTGAPLPAKFLGVFEEPARELPQVRRLLVGSALFLLFWFPSDLVADLVSWSHPGLGRPLAWAMVGAAALAMAIGAAAPRVGGRGFEIAVTLVLVSLVTATWVLAIALGRPSGNRSQVLEFLGWSSVLLLGLCLLLRCNYLLRRIGPSRVPLG